MAQTLGLVLCLLALSFAASVASSPLSSCISSQQPQQLSANEAWTCIQQTRLERLQPLLLAAGQSGAPLLSVAAYLAGRPVADAAELQLWSSVRSTSAYSRHLLQLSGALEDTQLAGGELTTTTLRTSRYTAPDGSLYATGEDFSKTSVPLDEALAQRLAAFAPTLLEASNTFLSAVSDPTQQPAAPEATAMSGAQQQTQQQQMERMQPTLRIIGGVQAPTDRKYVCSLRTSTGSSTDFLYCGCSLIAPSVVLTAAHCLASTDLRTPWVEIGRYFQQRPNDTSVNDYDRVKCKVGVPNSRYTESPTQNDIALCFLESPSRFAPVKLAEEATTKLTSGQQLTVMGWGAVKEGGEQSPGLMTVDVATTDLATCNAAYGGTVNGQTQICAGVPEGGKDACQGDSGGPLVIRGLTAAEDVQVGLVSYGIGCGRPNVPGIYTDVRAYRSWIANQMLARGVTFDPVTKGVTPDNTTGAAVDQATACACSKDGASGDTFVGQNLAGCKQHGLDVGDTDWYCYTQGGSACLAATQSSSYPGAAWMDCTPEAAATQGATTTPTTSSSTPTGASGSSNNLANQIPVATTASTSGLSNWLSQVLFGSLFGRSGPNNNSTTSAGSPQPTTAATNSTQTLASKVSRRVAQPVAARG